MFTRLLLLMAALLAVSPAWSQVPPGGADIPSWFSQSFLDFREDVAEAARDGRQVMIYFGQDGCPYCKELLTTNFSRPEIVDKTRAHFEAVALDIWGDRPVTWVDGTVQSEKALAKRLKVQFTPTIVFLDREGRVSQRLNGYYPPHRFSAALDYVIKGPDPAQPLAAYLERAVREQASADLNAEPFFAKPPYRLDRKGGKPIAVLWETRYCAPCDEMHREGFVRPQMKALLARFEVVRLTLGERSEVVTPAGETMPAEEWARRQGIAYTPSVVFFDGGREVFRIEAYLRPFHLATSFAYVADRAYRKEPEFQRFLQGRADELRARGENVELWK
ncbi:MAG: thioredoxin fold domain-containing protein [Rhodocyclaceae bacterium]|nr:thioredoxin fold domain-containing protein [Rhodocyclaceae bacterium]MCP5241675.1 thioredoxin fold domain-containing protein [Zoogloeaceae bacterium]MCP5255030.1 thioredoxin fold domain-containing protein [Zoogloeaceae bacterium]MCP5295487.1 thioredoxin fold domain-containing protein [Zoogloeaceae bacterium]MCW5616371.1 thioredoxin fold domain-containing protein [Rhodocyclaceae bacterium]